MSNHFRTLIALIVTSLAVVPLHAAMVSKQNSEAFATKLARIQKQGADGTAGLRTPLTEDELNSWFAYQGQPLLPTGVTQPEISMIGAGKVVAKAVVDLDAIGSKRKPSGYFDPFSLLAGKVPMSVTGTLQARDGMGRFDMESAEISGIPVPVSVLQELLTYYSRSATRPDGVKLDSAFPLPAKIRQIEMGQGQAVVVQ